MGKVLWKPTEDRVKASNMYRFIQFVNERFGRNLRDFNALYRWSIDHIPDFWASLWDFAGIIASEPYDRVVDDVKKMPGAQWFSGARLNFAENL
ncbi:MAG: acetoacetate--CoA ligase, partial [Desulfobacterales bacterium CG23_combo_of_CG06-09_8_20_14_all_52_9]